MEQILQNRFETHKKTRFTKTTKVLKEYTELEKAIEITHGENSEKIILESEDPYKKDILAQFKRYKKDLSFNVLFINEIIFLSSILAAL